MSLCLETCRKRASVSLVLAIVLIALPGLVKAQTAPAPKAAPVVSSDDAVPKAELFVGYQWLNPGGNIPDVSTSPPTAFSLPSISQGFGSSLAWNFTKYLALEGNYGGDWNRNASISAIAVGPKLTYRGEGVNFFVHTLFGYERLSSRGIDPSNGIVAILGGGMDLKIWKPLSLRLFEADFQYSRQNFANNVPPDDGSLRRPTYYGERLTTGLVLNLGGAPALPVAAACSVQPTEVMVGEPGHANVAPPKLNPQHT